MNFATGDDALEALAALGAKMETHGAKPVSLLICGGAALNISGLLTRATADVDVLGRAGLTDELSEMPDWLFVFTEEVAAELGLESGWLNDAALSLSQMGLPQGILSRAARRTFANSLEIAIASRLDLIALKCFAALDAKVSKKHLGDLVDLNPTPEEMNFATDWLLDRPTSPEFRTIVCRLCHVLGHFELARRLEE
jgi:hypothetical protein